MKRHYRNETTTIYQGEFCGSLPGMWSNLYPRRWRHDDYRYDPSVPMPPVMGIERIEAELRTAAYEKRLLGKYPSEIPASQEVAYTGNPHLIAAEMGRQFNTIVSVAHVMDAQRRLGFEWKPKKKRK